jgi:hypothetical protein
MFFGYFFGLFEGRGQGYKRGRKEEAKERQEPTAPPAAVAEMPKAEHQRGLLVLGLNESGRPQLHIDGHAVDALRVSAEQRRRLIDLMVMLKPWVDAGAASATTPPRATAFKQPPGVEDQAVGAVRGGTSASAAPAPSTTTAAPGAQLSLVAQIDSILQGRLAGTALAEKAIRLAESLHGGAVVFVGSNQYDGVDKVPDPEIQAEIRAAIAEWEKKFTPG